MSDASKMTIHVDLSANNSQIPLNQMNVYERKNIRHKDENTKRIINFRNQENKLPSFPNKILFNF